MASVNNMNSAAAEINLAYSMVPANQWYHSHQAEAQIFGDGQNSNFFSGFDPIQRNSSAANNLDMLMVEELLNPICYSNQVLPQTLPPAFHTALETQGQNNMHSQLCARNIDEIFEEPCHNVYGPVLALPPVPASGISNPVITSASNVASLMPSYGTAEADTISFEQYLVSVGVVRQAPEQPPSSVCSASATALIPHSQFIQPHKENLAPQSHILGFKSIAENDGIIQMPKRTRVLTPDEGGGEAMNGRSQMLRNQIVSFANNAAHDAIIQMPQGKRGPKPDGSEYDPMNRRMRRILKNRDSAARSRARKRAREVEMEAELIQLREENNKLKKTMHEIEAKNNKGGQKLRRTISCP